MAIRVVLFDDNKKFRDSLAILIDGSTGFQVGAVFADATDVIKKIEESHPDVVLMDIEMPNVKGTDALRQIKAVYPKLNVLMQTVFEDDDLIFEAICNGASGYVLKNMPPTKLLEAISEAYSGGAPMSSIIAKKLLTLVKTRNEDAQKPESEKFHLTPRELDVLTHMVNGMSYKMIAAQCGISFETVRYHIKNIYEKLHVVTMTEAVVKAVKNNLIK